MNVLIACEESQRVCTAFREKGHRAFSCDIQPCSGGHPEWHVQGDVIPLLNGNCTFCTSDTHTHTQSGPWDLIIAHPPCTYLSNAATRAFSLRVTPAEKVAQRWSDRCEAAIFFMQCALANCEKIAIENPLGFMNRWRKPDQTINPYQFAKSTDDVENYQLKRTCLWLKNLPKLKTNDLPKPKPVRTYKAKNGKMKNVYFVDNHGKIGDLKLGKHDADARSKTFPGIAQAMAEQWG